MNDAFSDEAKSHQFLSAPWRDLTLPQLLQTCARARSERFALADAPDRARWTTGATQRLNFATYGDKVARLTAVLKALKLAKGERVLVALPNTFELPVTLLAVLAAGALPALLPPTLGAPAIGAAAEAIQASMIITCSQLASQTPMECAAIAAAQYMPLRHVCAFGESVSLGIVPLNKAMEFAGTYVADAALLAPGDDALITFVHHAGELQPVVHTHAQIIAAALAVLARTPLFNAGALISTVLPISMGAVAASIVAPLMAGAELHMHGPFDADILVEQVARLDNAPVMLPGIAESLLRGPLVKPDHPVILTYDIDRPVRRPHAVSRGVALLSLGEMGTALLAMDEADWTKRPLHLMHPMPGTLPGTVSWLSFEAMGEALPSLSGFGAARRWDQKSGKLENQLFWPVDLTSELAEKGSQIRILDAA